MQLITAKMDKYIAEAILNSTAKCTEITAILATMQDTHFCKHRYNCNGQKACFKSTNVTTSRNAVSMTAQTTSLN